LLVDALVLLVPLPKLVTFPTLEKPVEEAEAASSNVESEVNSSEDVASPEMSDEDAKKKIAKGSSEPQIQECYKIQKTVDVACRRIYQVIEKIEGATRALTSRCNSLSAISRLPLKYSPKYSFVAQPHTSPCSSPWIRLKSQAASSS